MRTSILLVVILLGIVAALQAAPQQITTVEDALKLIDKAKQLASSGQGSAAITAAKDALTSLETLAGSRDKAVIPALEELGELYLALGPLRSAETYFRRAVQLREGISLTDNTDGGAAYNSLATILRLQKNYKGAEEAYLRALTIRELVLGSEHGDTAASLDGLALAYAGQEDFDKAKPASLRALRIRTKLVGKTHQLVAESLDHLAGIYARQGEHSTATEYRSEEHTSELQSRQYLV